MLSVATAHLSLQNNVFDLKIDTRVITICVLWWEFRLYYPVHYVTSAHTRTLKWLYLCRSYIARDKPTKGPIIAAVAAVQQPKIWLYAFDSLGCLFWFSGTDAARWRLVSVERKNVGPERWHYHRSKHIPRRIDYYIHVLGIWMLLCLRRCVNIVVSSLVASLFSFMLFYWALSAPSCVRAP